MFRAVHEFSGVQRSTKKPATWTRAAALLAGVLTCIPVSAAPSRIEAPRHELSEAAKEPLQRGLIAAQQQDWKLAIRYLTDAEKADPDSPEILFNLGLASSKLPGYELRSMAWFQAFLLADPDAPNAKAVRNQLLTTEIAFESKIGKILEQLESVATVIQTNRMAFLGTVPQTIIPNLAAAHNFVGDTDGAARLLATYGVQESRINDHAYVNSVASTSRFADAVKLDYYEAMDFLYEQGDLAEARDALLSHEDDVTDIKWEDLACAAYEARNPEILQFAITKVSSSKHIYQTADDREDFFISIDKLDEAKKLAAAPNSGASYYLLYLEGKLHWKAEPPPACDRHFWWGKNRRKYLIDFALNGLVLDSKSKLDDTQLDQFLTQQGALMTGSGGSQSDPMQEYLRVTNPLAYTSGEIVEMTKAYRIIRGPKSG